MDGRKKKKSIKISFFDAPPTCTGGELLLEMHSLKRNDEIKKIWLFLDSGKNQMPQHTKSAIKIMLLTGVRTSELRLAQWEELNLEDSLWTIPAEHCKGGETLKIHLSPQVKVILRELKEVCDTGHVVYGADNRPKN